MGVIPDRYAKDDPHPDAILAAKMMGELDAWELCLPDDWNPISDFGEIGEIWRGDSAAAALGRAKVQDALDDLTYLRDGVRCLKGGVRRLVMRYAVLNGEPGWEVEPPEVRYVMAGKNRPAWFRREKVQGEGGVYEVEADGYDRKAHRPYADAYRKQTLTPDPFEGIRDRGLHEIYVAALHVIHGELADNLTRFALEPPSRSARPWEEDAMAKPRLLLGKPQIKLKDRADSSPMPETDHVAPTGLTRALARPIRKKDPVRRVEPA